MAFSNLPPDARKRFPYRNWRSYTLFLVAFIAINLFFVYGCVTLRKSADPIVADRDGDGVPDPQDVCPDQAGILEMMGCADSDGDGVSDAKDRCPDVAGLPSRFGCPMQDSDEDGVGDDIDACPTERGSAGNRGCPEVIESIAFPGSSVRGESPETRGGEEGRGSTRNGSGTSVVRSPSVARSPAKPAAPTSDQSTQPGTPSESVAGKLVYFCPHSMIEGQQSVISVMITKEELQKAIRRFNKHLSGAMEQEKRQSGDVKTGDVRISRRMFVTLGSGGDKFAIIVKPESDTLVFDGKKDMHWTWYVEPKAVGKMTISILVYGCDDEKGQWEEASGPIKLQTEVYVDGRSYFAKLWAFLN
ncbi:MAG TPA: thrombospondin type 3 repeat-containing protein, partial [Flavobacterium sp.]|nr:thrombospondin type 3 repeat-containing protein [Flavobacterium sp.]